MSIDHDRPLGPAYAQRVKKSKRGEYVKGVLYIIGGVWLLPALGYAQLMWPMIALGVVSIAIGFALGNGYSNWLRVALGAALVGATVWAILQIAPALMAF